MHTQKLGIIGVGHVGQQVLAYAAGTDIFGEIVTIDNRSNINQGEALDQAHATGLISRNNIHIHAGTYADLRDADIIIIAASHQYAPDPVPQDRQMLLTDNATIIREIMTEICAVTDTAILIFISNPADTVAYLATDEFDYPAHQIMSTGCMLDSARLRYHLAEHYQVDPKSISAYMMGEHGYTAFPVLSHASIAGIPFDQLGHHFPEIPPLDPDALRERIVQAAYDVFDAKSGVTNAAVAQAAVDLARSIILNEHAIYPIATLIEPDHYDLTAPVAFSIPTIVTRNGWTKRLFVELNEWEQSRLQIAVDSIRANIDLAQNIK